MFGKPPDVVPDHLSAREYFELGQWYEEERLYGQARNALNRAIKLDPDSPIAIQCRRFLHSRIPAKDIPQEVIDRFRRAEPQLAVKPAEARRVADKIIAEYPDFEWPHRLLADLYLRNGDVAGCIAALQEALRINPDYAPALVSMARAFTADMQYEKAGEYLRRAQDAMPDDDELRRLQRGLEFLIELE